MSSLNELIVSQKDNFIKLDAANGQLLDWKQECLFARQQITKNKYSIQVAEQNQGSLQAAILNVAAIGISLNPARAHAYLVPRDNAICLDISYRGLVYIATDAGAIKWAKAELVYENDEFKYRGPSTPPHHEADVFSDRGELKGGYVIAKMPDGEVMIEVMKAEEIYKVRDTSKAFQKGSGPWVDWFEEMAKKTLIKRAYKSWPQLESKKRIDTAVSALNEHEGIAYTIDQQTELQKLIEKGDPLALYAFWLDLSDDEAVGLMNSFEYGKKTEMKRKLDDLRAEGRKESEALSANLAACLDEEDEQGVAEILESVGGRLQELVINRLSPEHQHKLQEIRDAA